MPAQQQERLTKRQRRVLRQQGILDTDNQLSSGFTVKSDIAPMTDNQALAFESWDEGQNLMLHGIAGTGKTFLVTLLGHQTLHRFPLHTHRDPH